MAENLFLPNIPVSPMFIGDDRVMTIEWQEFFRILTDRAGGISAPDINETDISGVAELYSTPIDSAKEISELEKKNFTKPANKSYDKRIDELEGFFLASNLVSEKHIDNDGQAMSYYFGII